MHDLVIYGAGGLGREVAEIVRRINERHLSLDHKSRRQLYSV